jgi:hypothetical protein
MTAGDEDARRLLAGASETVRALWADRLGVAPSQPSDVAQPRRGRRPGDELEKHWQARVRAEATAAGWRVVHHPTSIGAEPGWPDLVLIRPPTAAFVEVKAEGGRLTPAQVVVLAELAGCGLTVAVWRPSDEQAVWAWLHNGGPIPQPWAEG